MGDTSVMKVSSQNSPRGEEGQKYLATGITLSMRMWEDQEPGGDKEPRARDYETVGFVIRGRAELHTEGQVLILEPGDSWTVPRGATHTYNILETFTAVEVTHPPFQVHGRDE
jgi:quercetin dioxygenase-like cupin family protein